MESLLIDLRYAFRMLRKNLGFTVVALVTLALGIAANTTILSWINATLLHPIPGVSRPSEMIAVEMGRAGSFSYPDFLDLRDRGNSFAGLTAFAFAPASLTGDAKPERIWAMMVTANYFGELGVEPAVDPGNRSLAVQLARELREEPAPHRDAGGAHGGRGA